MKIAVLGTGSVGQAFAERLTGLGHDVMIGTRNATEKWNDPKFSAYLSKNQAVQLGTFAEATAFGQIAINVSKGQTTIETLHAAGKENLRGKILIDLSNPLDFSKGMPPGLIPGLSNFNSLGEEIQRQFTETLVVKTLNTMWNGIMLNPLLVGNGDHVNYICGNDASAKSRVIDLLKEFGWKENAILDLGDISAARATEAMLPIWLRVYGVKQSGAFNFKIVT
jgi:predicted dinucleotide-binding enzyme